MVGSVGHRLGEGQGEGNGNIIGVILGVRHGGGEAQETESRASGSSRAEWSGASADEWA